MAISRFTRLCAFYHKQIRSAKSKIPCAGGFPRNILPHFAARKDFKHGSKTVFLELSSGNLAVIYCGWDGAIFVGLWPRSGEFARV